MITQIRFRRGTSQEWATYNPILGEGEPGVDTTLDRFKLGDGVTPWLSLPFQSYSIDELNTVLERVDAAAASAQASAAQAVQAANAAAQAVGIAAAFVPDPNDPGTFIVSNPAAVGEDPTDPGFFLIGVQA